MMNALKFCYNQIPEYALDFMRVSEPLLVYDFQLTEEHLHFLWRTKAFNLTNSKLHDGRNLRISNAGEYNAHASGPDFKMGAIAIDEMNWVGNIEMHLKSSDWYAHKHESDSAYDNVVLHVVWKHDREVFVKGEILPTLELRNYVDKLEFERLVKFLSTKNELPCDSSWKNVSQDKKDIQVEISFRERIERRVEWVEALMQNAKSKEQAVYQMLGSNFGNKLNNLSFSELLIRVPYALLEKTNFDSNEALFHGASGLLNGNDWYINQLKIDYENLKTEFSLSEMKEHSWLFSGLRPASFPSLKIAQFASIVSGSLINYLLSDELELNHFKIKQNLACTISTYWKNHVRFGKTMEIEHKFQGLSEDFLQGILINVVVPIQLYFARINNDIYREKELFYWIESFPAEKNSIVKNWKNKGMVLKNATHSQGILELNNEFCKQRRCLECAIGKQLMGKIDE